MEVGMVWAHRSMPHIEVKIILVDTRERVHGTAFGLRPKPGSWSWRVNNSIEFRVTFALNSILLSLQKLLRFLLYVTIKFKPHPLCLCTHPVGAQKTCKYIRKSYWIYLFIPHLYWLSGVSSELWLECLEQWIRHRLCSQKVKSPGEQKRYSVPWLSKSIKYQQRAGNTEFMQTLKREMIPSSEESGKISLLS